VVSITFRCKSCATLLRARANKAVHQVRCKRCGTIVTVPERNVSGAQAGYTADEGATGQTTPDEKKGDLRETEDRFEPAPSERLKRRHGRKSAARSADPRSDGAWRRVRLGLILIALAMSLSFLGMVVFFFVPFGWTPLRYTLQALPIAGNLLCALVPLKGAARILTLTNLGVIALGLALTLFASRILQRAGGQSLDRSQNLLRMIAESDKEEQEMRKSLADLRTKAAAGDKDAAIEERELKEKLDDARSKRIAEIQKETERKLAEIKDTPSTSIAGLLGFWNWLYLHGTLISSTIQIVIISFFIRTIALALDDKDLAGSSPRVAALALLTLALVLLSSILPLGATFVHRLLRWTLYAFGLVSFVWQGFQLVEACTLIGKHISTRST
jgi:hypothetical protein